MVPAAGGGARLQADRPKQYVALLGRPILQHTLERLCRYPSLRGLLVGIAVDDPYWPAMALQMPKLLGSYTGGAQRAQTVLNGLREIGRAHV